jgi:hypothetical protein
MRAFVDVASVVSIGDGVHLPRNITVVIAIVSK